MNTTISTRVIFLESTNMDLQQQILIFVVVVVYKFLLNIFWSVREKK